MADKFNLTAQLQLQAPTNTRQVANTIQKDLSSAGNIKTSFDGKSLAKANSQMRDLSKVTKDAGRQVRTLNRDIGESARRFGVITIATGSLIGFTNALKNGVKEAINFEKELIKISQVTGKTTKQLGGLTREINRLSTGLGASSKDLLDISRTLLQTGLSAEKTRKALDILAKTSLGATFDNIQDTTEGAIALLRQFGDQASRAGGEIKFLESSLDAVNAVSKRFAVESSDIITAIRKTGGVFASAGGQVEELIALFTSVRATTRESADTIATGLRTIFTRIQRVETIDQLKALGIQLQDSQGRFVGAYKAFQELAKGLAVLDPRDFRFSEIVESLGGFRQVGKVIPLIQQFTTAQDALNVALNANGSVSKDAETAQQSLANKIDKTKEKFAELLRTVVNNKGFQDLARIALNLADSLVKVVSNLENVLPLLTAMLSVKIGSGIARIAGGFFGSRARGNTGPVSRFATGGKVLGFNNGGVVPGTGNRDTVPAMLTPGEFVIKKSSVAKMGAGQLEAMNNNRYNEGGEFNPKKQIRPNVKRTKTTKAKQLLTLTGDPNAAGLFYLDNAYKTGSTSRPLQKDFSAKQVARLTSNRTANLLGLREDDRLKVDFDIATAGIGKKPRIKLGNVIESGFAEAVANGSRVLADTFDLPPLVNANEKAALKVAQSSISEEQLRSLEGAMFEAIISSTSGAALGDSGSALDIPKVSIKALQRLGAMFDIGNNKVVGAELKRTLSSDTFGKATKGSMLAKMINVSARTPGQFGIKQKRKKLNAGGSAGVGSPQDTVPALLTPGEFVINKEAANRIGTANLNMMNKQGVARFNKGGSVGVQRFGVGGEVEGGGAGLRLGAGEVGGFGDLLAAVKPVTKELKEIADIGGQVADSLKDIAEISFTERAAAGLSGEDSKSSARDLALGESRDKRRQEQLAEKERRSQEKFGTSPVESSPGKNVTKFNINNRSGDDAAKLAKAQQKVAERLGEQGATVKQARKASLIYRREILNGAKNTDAYATAVAAVSPEMLKMLTETKKSTGGLKSLASAGLKKASEINKGGVGGLLKGAKNLLGGGGGPPGGGGGKLSAQGVSGLAEGADRIAGAVQNFVFLGSAATLAATQLLGLDESTSKVVGELAGLATGALGLAGTVVQVVTSTVAATASILANTSARTANTASMLKAGGAVAGIAAAIGAGILVMEYWSRSAREAADQISSRRKKSIDNFKEGEGSRPDTDVLLRGIEDEARARQQAADYAVTTSKGFQIAGAGIAGAAAAAAATAGAFALAGSAVPVLGTAIGAVVGAFVGVGIYLLTASSNIEASIDATAVARKREAEALRESYTAFFNLIEAQNAFKDKLDEIDSTVGISDEERSKRKLTALETEGGGIGKLNVQNIEAAQNTREATVSRVQNQIRDDAAAKVSKAKEDGVEGEELGKLIAEVKAKAEQDVQQVARIAGSGGSEEDIRADLEKLGISAQKASTAATAFDLSAQQTSQSLKSAAEQESAAREVLGQSLASVDFRDLGGSIDLVNRANNVLIESIMAKRDAELAAATTEDQKTKIADKYSSAIDAQNQATRERITQIRENKAAMDLEIAARQALNAQIRQQEQTIKAVNEANIQAERDLRSIDFDSAIAAGQTPEISLDSPVLSGISTGGIMKELDSFRSSLGLVSADLRSKGVAAAQRFETTTKNVASAQGLIGKDIKTGDEVGSVGGKSVAAAAGLNESQVSQLFGGSSEQIEKFYTELANRANKVGGITQADIDELLAPAKARAEGDAKIIEGINKNANIQLQAAQKAIKEEQAARERSIASIEKFNNINDTLSDKLAEITGDTSIDRAKNEGQAAQRKLDAGRESRGGTAITANDPTGTAAIRDQAKKDIQSVQAEIKAAKAPGASDTAALGGLMTELQRLQNTVADSEAELERFATSTTKLDAIQEKLAKATAAREQGFSVMSDFVIGGQSERQNLQSGAAGIFSAIRTGTTQNQSEEQRKQTFGLLDQLSGVENVFGSGKTGKELKNELITKDAIRLGFPPDLAKQLATQTTTEEKLLEEAKTQTALQKEAAGKMLTPEDIQRIGGTGTSLDQQTASKAAPPAAKLTPAQKARQDRRTYFSDARDRSKDRFKDAKGRSQNRFKNRGNAGAGAGGGGVFNAPESPSEFFGKEGSGYGANPGILRDNQIFGKFGTGSGYGANPGIQGANKQAQVRSAVDSFANGGTINSQTGELTNPRAGTAETVNGENTTQSEQNPFAQFSEGLNNIVTQFSSVTSALTQLSSTFQDGIQINHNFSGDMTLALNIQNSDALKAALGEAITPKIKELIEQLMGNELPTPDATGSRK